VVSVGVLVLTEDSAKDAHETIAKLATEMFRLLDKDVQRRHVSFAPASTEEAQAMRANLWRSGDKRDHHRQVTLRKAIASRVAEGSFVLFHFDGDCPWAERESALTRKKFESLIRLQVRAMLELQVRGNTAVQQRRRRERQVDQRTEPEIQAEVERLLGRLIALVPHYSIEAWLLQNVGEAERICKNEHGDPRHLAAFEGIRDDRSALEELIKPKDSSCLGANYNLELASNGFPASEVDAVGKSFHAAVESLRTCPGLLAALASTHS
jgi:hypothetical protein